MQSSPGNITMRTDVYSRGQRRNKPVGLDLENTNNKILNNIIKKWPSQLEEKFYSDWKSTKVSVCYIDELQELLNNYLEMDDLSNFFPNIEEILMAIEEIKILKPDSSNTDEYDSGCTKFTSESSKIPISKCYKYLSSILIIGFVVIILSVCALKGKNELTTELSKIEEWEKNMIEIRKKFPSQNEKMWFSIQAGVKTTVIGEPIQPSVFLLTYNDKKTSTCLAHSVGKEVTKLLSESAQEPIIIKGEDLKRNKSLSQDYGLFTETYKHDIEEKHVMIVLDLQEIPSALAQSFHILCDVENPLIPNAAFLFTLQIHDEEKNPTAVAEKHLKLLWKDSLDVDIMDPLITRVTNAVFSVKLETDLPC